MAMIPNIGEIQALAGTVLRAVPEFQAASAKIRGIRTVIDSDLANDAQSVVVVENGTKSKVVADRLRSVGLCVEVCPVVGGSRRDQGDQVAILDVDIMVKFQVNVSASEHETNGAQMSVYDALRVGIRALCREARHPGGERFKLAQDAFYLSDFNEGVWTYAAMFTKEAIV